MMPVSSGRLLGGKTGRLVAVVACLWGAWGCAAVGNSGATLPYASREGVAVLAPTVIGLKVQASGAAVSSAGLDRPPHPLVLCAPPRPSRVGLWAADNDAAWVDFVVNERGLVESAKIESESAADFGRAAVAAILTWRFEPMTCAGAPVKVELRELVYTGYPPDQPRPACPPVAQVSPQFVFYR